MLKAEKEDNSFLVLDIYFKNKHTGSSTSRKPLIADTLTKVCRKSLPLSHPNKNFNFFLPSTLKIFKTAYAQPIHKNQNTYWTKTAKPLTDLTSTTRTTERQLVTSPIRKQGFCASKTGKCYI